MRISDWSSDVCSSDLGCLLALLVRRHADRAVRCRQLRPGGAEVLGAVQLHAEVAEVERRIERAVATVLQEGAHRIAEEAEIARRLPAASLDQEQALAGRHEEFFSHFPTHQTVPER